MNSSGELTVKLEELAKELISIYPFYQSLSLDKNHHQQLFEKLPFVDKRIISRQRTLFEQPSLGEVIETYTSGTTGVPFRCIKTPLERMMLSLALYKQRKKWGLPAKHRMILLSERLLSDFKALEHYATSINRDRPHMIQGRASGLYMLAQYFKEKRYEVPKELLFVQNWGEHLHDGQKLLVERTFGVPCVDFYGMEELWCIAFSNLEGELEIDQESVYVEIVDASTNQVLPHGQYGEVIVTSFLLRSIPLVRYRTGDIGRLMYDPVTKVLSLQLLPVRSSQIKLPDRVLPSALFRYLDRFFYELSISKGIQQFQIIQESHTAFRLLVVSDMDLSEDAVLKPKLVGFLRQCLASDVKLIIENVETIAPNPESGKFQSFISFVS